MSSDEKGVRLITSGVGALGVWKDFSCQINVEEPLPMFQYDCETGKLCQLWKVGKNGGTLLDEWRPIPTSKVPLGVK